MRAHRRTHTRHARYKPQQVSAPPPNSNHPQPTGASEREESERVARDALISTAVGATTALQVPSHGPAGAL
eukprot:5678125-Alexandrium_andersonii.AAC.1